MEVDSQRPPSGRLGCPTVIIIGKAGAVDGDDDWSVVEDGVDVGHLVGGGDLGGEGVEEVGDLGGEGVKEVGDLGGEGVVTVGPVRIRRNRPISKRPV